MRLKLDNFGPLFCLVVCEYYAHVDCQDFVVSNCKECATYTPDNDRVGVCIKGYSHLQTLVILIYNPKVNAMHVKQYIIFKLFSILWISFGLDLIFARAVGVSASFA